MFQQMELVFEAGPTNREGVRAAGPAVTAETKAEAKAAFVLRLRARGIRDLALLRALEKVPREIFVPHRYVDLARRDLALPLGCGQTLSEPWLVARMIEAMALVPAHRVLEVGTGSGYATAILAEIVRNVVSVERFQSLAIAARLRLDDLGLANAEVLFGDGLALPREMGPFDRILLHGAVAEVPGALRDLLAQDGKMVLAKPDPGGAQGQILVEVSRNEDGSLNEQARGTCRLQPLVLGVARML